MRKLAVILTATLLVSGCATSPVIGPFSYMTSQSNRKAAIRRAAISSNVLTETQKQQVFGISAYTSSPQDIGVILKVDIAQLTTGNYTVRDMIKQVVGVTADAGLYALIISAAKAYNDQPEDGAYGVVIRGDYNNVYVTQGDSNNGTALGNYTYSEDTQDIPNK